MPCDCARTRMSSSSTTTSDPHRSPKPRIPIWGFRASRGSSGQDSAGIPRGFRSRCLPIRESAQPHLKAPLRLPRGSARSDDILGVAFGRVVEPGEDLRAPVADAAAAAEAARTGPEVALQRMVATGTRTTSATSWMVSSSSLACGVTGTAAHWILLMAYLLSGCRSQFATSGGCRSFSTRALNRSRWSIVRRRNHPLRTVLRAHPLGYVMLAQAKGMPESCPDVCRATENVNRPAPGPPPTTRPTL